MNEEKNQNQTIAIKLPSAEELVEAGVHLGHQTSRWNPKMEQYIFSSRNSVHIFDIEKTLNKLEDALTFLARILANSGQVIFVGTKPTAKAFVNEAAQELNMPYVSERWLGGTLTNYKIVAKRIQFLKDLEEQQRSGQWDKFTKRERLMLQRKMEKLQWQLAGIRSLTKLPEALFVADVKVDNIALREAKKMKIPVVAICDTNMDPSLVDYVIPANDDASSSLKILMKTFVDNLKGVKPATIAVENNKK